MLGIGDYGGIGLTVGGVSNGPLDTVSGGVYRYLEADAGWGISGGLSAQGSNDISGENFMENWTDGDTYEGDLASSFGMTPAPRVGVGYGAYSGMRVLPCKGHLSTPKYGD